MFVCIRSESLFVPCMNFFVKTFCQNTVHLQFHMYCSNTFPDMCYHRSKIYTRNKFYSALLKSIIKSYVKSEQKYIENIGHDRRS